MAQVPPEPVDSSRGTNGDQGGQSRYVSDDDYGTSIYARDYTSSSSPTEAFQQAGFPQNTMPWPGNSLYGPQFSQHYVKDGLWHKITNNEGRKYFFGLEALIARSSKTGYTFIGDVNIPATAGNLPPILSDTIFPKQSTGKFDNFNLLGMRGRWGFFNPDNSGFEANLWGTTDSDRFFRAPLSNDGDISNIAALRPVARIPIDDGAGGTNIVFTNEFTMEASSQAFGGNLHWMMSPKWQYSKLRIRPLWGLRYMQIQESFGFKGRESGVVNITFLESPAGSGMFAPTTGTGTQIFDPLETFLKSETRSSLAGPEIGLHYDLGGEKFKVWGKSIVGLLANNEDIRLEGDNFIQPFDAGFPVAPTPANPNPHRFSDKQTHNHVSPLFEQSLFAESQFFHLVPYLRKIKALQSAVVRVGYTYTVLGEIIRPASSITYASADPNFIQTNRQPGIQTRRSQWFISNWSFAIDWKY